MFLRDPESKAVRWPMISRGRLDGHTHGPPAHWPSEQSSDAPRLQGDPDKQRLLSFGWRAEEALH